MKYREEVTCPHYMSIAEPLEIGESPAYVSVRRCLLTERLVKLLRTHSEGTTVADKLVVMRTNGEEFAFVGPDLEAVSGQTCKIGRCEGRCSPGYDQVLQRYGIPDKAPEQVICEAPNPL